MDSATGRVDIETVSANVMEPVFAIDSDGVIVFANDRFLDIAQSSREDVVGREYDRFGDLVTDGFDAFVAGYERVVAGESDDERVELSMAHPDDAPVPNRLPAETRITPLMRDGARVGVVVSLRDISDRKRYERRLESQTEQLALLNRLLRHDIRNDASVITGWADLLADDLPDEHVERVETIRDAANHIEELTREAGDVAALIGESGDMDLETVEPVPYLREEVEKLRDTFPDVAVSLDIAAAARGVEIRGNSLIASVFGNLLRNAVVHNDSDRPRVEVTCERADGALVVSIADNGPGISDDRKAEVFDIGEKGLESSGMGLGLYLVSTLLELYDGEISVSDNDPTGAVFTIHLPISDG